MRKLLILVSVVALVVAFTLPAAAEVSFYGNVRMSTFWESFDPDTPGADTTSDLTWDLDDGSSRVGARFKHDSVGANVELRPRSASDMRHWNGTWNWGGGTLLIGQAWSPTFSCVSSSTCEGGLSGGRGDTYGSLRIPQVAVHIGSLQIAGARPTKTALQGGAATATLPKIEASYGLKAGPAAIKIYGGFNAYEEDLGATTADYSSMLLGANAVMGFGAAKVGVNLYMANNPGIYGEVGSNAQANTFTAAGEANDVDTLGLLVDFNYKLNPMMSIYAGYGQAVSELDTPGTNEKTNTYMYVGLPITLAKGVSLTPEIAITTEEHDVGAATTPAPSTTYYGAYWRVNF
jgi:hypothetical protein